jgi:hypothetical protein
MKRVSGARYARKKKGSGLTGLEAPCEQSYPKATVTRSTQYAGKQSICAMFVERSWTSNTEVTLMLPEQIKDDLRKGTGTWKKPAIPFTGILGRTMESRLHYQPRLKVLHGFALLHSMRAVR